MEQRNVVWMDGLSSRGIDLGLDRIRELMHRLGDPQDRLRTVHVAGSNGKGSTCAMIESIVRSSGLRSGKFTSPEVLSVTECFQVDGRDVSIEKLDSTIGKVRPHVEAMAVEGMLCTRFEVLTATAFLLFSEERVDVAVIEVGMGGREDSTNVIIPEVSVITSLSMEHAAFLGPTIGDIARAKAGIMKKGVPCVYLGNPETDSVIGEEAEELGCPTVRVDRTSVKLVELGMSGSVISYKGQRYEIGIPGSYQMENAALAVEAVRQIENKEGPWDIESGLSSCHLPFRMQHVEGTRIIVDPTHTTAGAVVLAKDVPRIYGKTNVVTGMLSDKDHVGILKEISKIGRVYLAPLSSPRAAKVETMSEAAEKVGCPVTVCGSVAEAMDLATSEEGYTLVTGSFVAVREALEWLETKS
ncbi:MAG: bifunctional folylpolyglutamate synthase/dihydrofolate synthase [Candidatus Methanomethylophilaceae archaeon]|nr:bifunctional folylpolyglutamate synthase/dihydrofolate synthase [Candidatus Methanomethylophilaceae archaeon]